MLLSRVIGSSPASGRRPRLCDHVRHAPGICPVATPRTALCRPPDRDAHASCFSLHLLQGPQVLLWGGVLGAPTSLRILRWEGQWPSCGPRTTAAPAGAESLWRVSEGQPLAGVCPRSRGPEITASLGERSCLAFISVRCLSRVSTLPTDVPSKSQQGHPAPRKAMRAQDDEADRNMRRMFRVPK